MNMDPRRRLNNSDDEAPAAADTPKPKTEQLQSAKSQSSKSPVADKPRISSLADKPSPKPSPSAASSSSSKFQRLCSKLLETPQKKAKKQVTWAEEQGTELEEDMLGMATPSMSEFNMMNSPLQAALQASPVPPRKTETKAAAAAAAAAATEPAKAKTGLKRPAAALNKPAVALKRPAAARPALKMDLKNLASRAYRRAVSEALRGGMSLDQAKAAGRDSHQKIIEEHRESEVNRS